MRRWPIMLAALLLMGMLPTRGTEISKLRPVKLLYVYREDEKTTVSTDTGDFGDGASLQDALQDLEKTSPGYIYLDTVEMLIITKETKSELNQFCRILRPSVRVCAGTNGMDPKAASEYLEAHPPGRTLMELQNGKTKLPELYMEEERYRIEQIDDGT